jgi:CDP-diacylglycerol--glycerol-3-phosphate 3-phosphatidyltransferase
VTLANALSATRGLLVIPVIALIATGDASYALVVFLGAAATDALDGPIARRRGATAFGAALDPLADKILVVGTLAALALRGLAPDWAVVLIFARELLAIEVRARAPQAVGASMDGKAKTVLQVAAIALLLAAAAWPAAGLARSANALLVAATALTVLSGVRLVLRAKQTTADTA